VEAVKAASPRHGASLANGRLVFMRHGEVCVYYPPAAGFHKATVTAQSGRAAVERALSEHLRSPTRLILDEGPKGASAPISLAEEDAITRSAHEKHTDDTIRGHPALRATLRLLGGELEHVQVLEPESARTTKVEPPEETE
jgi:hypothetical protein